MASAAKPWVTLSVVLLLALITRIVTAEDSSDRFSSNALPVRSPASVSRETIGSESGGMQIYAGPGMLVQSGATGFGMALGGYFPISSTLPLYLGLETGLDVLNYGSNAGTSTGMSALGIPVLGTFLYRFEKSSGKVPIQPSIGFSAGPNVYFMKYGGGRANQTVVYYEMLFRAALAFELSRGFSFNFEPKIGIVGSSAIFLSQASFLWNL